MDLAAVKSGPFPSTVLVEATLQGPEVVLEPDGPAGLARARKVDFWKRSTARRNCTETNSEKNAGCLLDQRGPARTPGDGRRRTTLVEQTASVLIWVCF